MIGETEEQHCKTEGQTHHGKEDFLRDRNKAQDQPSPVHPILVLVHLRSRTTFQKDTHNFLLVSRVAAKTIFKSTD